MQKVSETGWLWKRLRPYTPRVLMGLAAAVLSGATGTLDPLLMRHLIDVALPRGKGDVSPRALLIIALCVVLISLFSVARSALGVLGGQLSFRVAQLLGQDLKVELLAHMTRLSADWHARVFLGEKLSRIQNDVDQISLYGADFANSAVRSVIFFIANLAIMFAMNWRVTIAVLPLLPIFVWVRSHFRGKIRRRADLSRAEIGKASGRLAEHLGAVPDIQILGAEEARTARTVESWNDALDAQWAQRRAEGMFSVAVNTVLALGILIVLGLGVYEYFLGALSLGGFVAFYTYVLRIFDPVAGAMELYSRTQQMMASSRRVREVLETPSSVPDNGDVASVPDPLVTGLACDDVSFAYPLGETVLRSVDLRIGPNERIALIGASGSGKSTLSRLLARMADPTSGSVNLEGRTIPEYSLKTLRSAVCYVPQHPVLFSGSIRQNLLDANPAASQAEIDEVVDAAQLRPVVSRFPGGLDSILGPEATGLSGGERQRLAIARALLRHSPILVLDESTSALDLPTEEAVFRAIASLRPDRAVVLISHRLRSLTWVDRMILLDSGSIVAQGTHASLYRESMLYRRLYENDVDMDKRAPKVRTDADESIDGRGEGLLVEH